MTKQSSRGGAHARTQAALRESEARLRQALDTADMGTWTWDMVTGLGTLDARGAAIVGLDGAVVPNEPFDVAEAQRNSIHPEDLVTVESAIAQGLKEGRMFVLRYRITARDGQLRHVLSNVRVETDTEGRPVRLSGTNRDVTVEREAESTWQRLNEELESRVRARTSEIDGLFARLASAHEEERRRIARDIHDQLGQQVTAIRISIDALRGEAGKERKLEKLIEATSTLVRDLDNTVGFLTSELRPAALDDFGLSAALANLVSSWSERFAIKSRYDTFGVDGVRLAPDVEINLYRVVQEALHNIYKHAQATQVNVMFEKRDERLLLVVEDNGIGFAEIMQPRVASSSLGLVHMRERAKLIGGGLTIESTRTRGTTLIVRVPV